MESLIIHGAIETEKHSDCRLNFTPLLALIVPRTAKAWGKIDFTSANLKIRGGGIDEKTDMYLHYICFCTCTCR